MVVEGGALVPVGSHVPRAFQSHELFSQFQGQRAGLLVGCLAKDDKDRTHGPSLMGTVVRPSAIVNGAGTDFPVSAYHNSERLATYRKLALKT